MNSLIKFQKDLKKKDGRYAKAVEDLIQIHK